jgi:uncharacterized membrane protein
MHAHQRGGTTLKRSRLPSRFFTDHEKEIIRKAVEDAESTTSGEIRTHLDRRCPGEPLEAARAWFDKLGMRATRERNGVLLYLAIADRKFALYGDEGIHGKLPQGTWERLRDAMLAEFAGDRFAEGIALAVREIGEALKTHFPHRANDVDELSDDISVSDR